MTRVFGIACAALMLIAPLRAETAKPAFAKDTQVVVVGPITSPPKGAINEKKMQVAVGPDKTDYTLHFRNAKLYGLRGQKIDEDGLDDGMWVRAEGRIGDDPRRITVDRVQVIAPDAPGHKKGAFFRPGYEYGYVSSVAGSREIFPVVNVPASLSAPFVVVGKISDDTGGLNATRKLQLQSQGFEWTLHVPKDAAVMNAAGKPLSVHEVSKGQWVRAYGWKSGDLRMRVERMENLGADEAFRATKAFRSDYPFGYFETPQGENLFQSSTMSGTIVRIDKEFGTVTIRDANGNERTFFTDVASLKRGNDPVYLDDLRSGETIIIESRSYRFER
jgi:hypothetical protein